MKKIYLIGHITICNVLLVMGQQRCFKYTWPGPILKKKNVNCTDCPETCPYVPCIEPVYESEYMPNTTFVWENLINETLINGNNASEFFCPMEESNVCVKYTYIYNSAVVNVSYFCGKVIEDQTTAITSGCFVHYTEGYTVEVCACRSRYGLMPCNSTIRNTYSMLIIFIATAISLLMYAICNIF